jgi:hypothetical protein
MEIKKGIYSLVYICKYKEKGKVYKTKINGMKHSLFWFSERCFVCVWFGLFVSRRGKVCFTTLVVVRLFSNMAQTL